MYEGLSDRELMVAVYFSLRANQRFISGRERPDNFEELSLPERINHIAWKDKKLGEMTQSELLAALKNIEALNRPRFIVERWMSKMPSPTPRKHASMSSTYDPSGWLCCAAVPGYPFKRVSQMTLEELQQTLCHIIATDTFNQQGKAVATHWQDNHAASQ